jgi:hypothetical protein
MAVAVSDHSNNHKEAPITPLEHLQGLPDGSPSWYRTSDVIRIVEVAKKYLPEDVSIS